MTKEEIVTLIENGELGKAWHGLGELLHKKPPTGPQPNDGGSGQPTPPPGSGGPP